jgi:RNA polymerase sigma-70 factor, ECF subfamily
VVDAFFRAARGGDFESLVALLDPDVVLRADAGDWRPALSVLVRGAEDVAGQAMRFALPHAELVPVLVNGTAGVVVTVGGRPFSIVGFTVSEGRITEIDAVAGPERVQRVAAGVLG